MTEPSPQPHPLRYKIIESAPDRNGIIIIAIKPDVNGKYTSRDEALDGIRASHSSTKSSAGKVLDELENWIAKECTYRRGSLYDALEMLRAIRQQEKKVKCDGR